MHVCMRPPFARPTFYLHELIHVHTHPCLTQNKNLRERIDRLRKDRVIFDNVYKRLESSLHEKKNEMVRFMIAYLYALLIHTKAKHISQLVHVIDNPNQQTQVIEDAKRVCIARDKAKSELAAIKHQAEKDKAEFDVRGWT